MSATSRAFSTDTKSTADAFWNRYYTESTFSRDLKPDIRRAVMRAHTFFGPLEGRTLLDIGCGTGDTALYWAKAGANVTAVDASTVGIEVLRQRCEQLGITTITATAIDATRIDELGQFDCVFGSMILHHLEPFHRFAEVLRRSIKTGGQAFFYENNAASKLLIWFRTHIVGRLWVPKAGDPDEFPLTREEVDVLRDLFTVTIEYPQMYFFQMASSYVFRRRLKKPLRAIDNFLYRHNIAVDRSYWQYLLLGARS
jgi:2-polyprenyl-3-methyl-5-hydroxy-6-metoxy-1,4-benzoquinol methylase